MKLRIPALCLTVALSVFLAASPTLAEPAPDSPLTDFAESDGDRYFVSGERSRTGDLAEAWVFVAHAEPPEVEGSIVLGAWIHMRFDCVAAISTTLEMVAVDEHLASVFRMDRAEESETVNPQTVSGGLMDFACDGTTGDGTTVAGIRQASTLARLRQGGVTI